MGVHVRKKNDRNCNDKIRSNREVVIFNVGAPFLCRNDGRTSLGSYAPVRGVGGGGLVKRRYTTDWRDGNGLKLNDGIDFRESDWLGDLIA